MKSDDDLLALALPPSSKIGSNMARISRRGRPIFQSLKPALLKLQSICSTCALVICLILLVLSLLAVAFKPLNKTVHVLLIESDEFPRHVTNGKFLSIALDSSLIAQGFKNFNLTNPKLLKLMKPLSPGYLRIGGTMADRLWFVTGNTVTFKTIHLTEIDGGKCSYEDDFCNQLHRSNFTMSGSEWLQLNKLAADAGFTVLFDLNVLIRHDNGSWNSENAEKLIRFSDHHSLRVIWELGNEPNSFRHVFNYAVDPNQLALDFMALRMILNRYPRYKNSLLVGPDTTRPIPSHNASELYLQRFLKKAGHIVDAVTWHQYYFGGQTASSADFLNPDIFNLLEEQISLVKDIVAEAGVRNKPIWLGETSSAYHGGAPGYSNRYIATFIWLDKLGLAARNGLDLVVRQTLFGGNYALIDHDLAPTPDWWLSVLYKTLVGPEVVPCFIASSKLVRLYCQCTQRKSLYNIVSSVTVFGLNMKSTEAKIRIEGYRSQVLEYILTPYVTLLSKYIFLNDEALYLLPNGNIPMFKPKVVDSKPYLIMPPYSLAFWIVPVSSVKYCHSPIDTLGNM